MKKGLSIHGLAAIVGAIIIAYSSAVGSQPMTSKYPNVDWKKAEANYIVALASDNQGIRQSAAHYVAIYQLTGAVEPLISLLKGDKIESVRMTAALALITLGDRRGRSAVEETALYDGSDKVSQFCESLLDASQEKFSALD